MAKRVKQFKHYVPQLDLSYVETIVHVSFNADDGTFSIPLPEHIADVVSAGDWKFDYEAGDARIYGKGVWARVMDHVIAAYKQCCARFVTILRQQSKSKVIRVTLAYNLHRRGYESRSTKISFTGSPAMHFTYEVLWKAGGRLYEQYGADDRLTDKGSANQAHAGWIILDWTEERETFLKGIHEKFCTLIDTMADFTTALAKDPDNAIAAARGVLALPAPEGPANG